ncbi:unannotated protein [freshwater metagenome]|uniref:Unannotated protein n=1 Tax=freshwater metagenome TaxID=449393 RepID=A0A6J7UE05_9ZZZZ
MIITGIAEIASRILIKTMSNLPFRYPAISPREAPTNAPKAVAINEMTMMILAPMITREYTSRPVLSVPNQYLSEGGVFIDSKSIVSWSNRTINFENIEQNIQKPKIDAPITKALFFFKTARRSANTNFFASLLVVSFTQ